MEGNFIFGFKTDDGGNIFKDDQGFYFFDRHGEKQFCNLIQDCKETDTSLLSLKTKTKKKVYRRKGFIMSLVQSENI